MSEAEEQIRAVIDRRIAALRNKDSAAAVDCLAEDVVAFELAPPLVQSAGAARDADALAAWRDGFEDFDIEVRDLAIEADGDVGFAHALHHLTGVRVSGAPMDLWLRSTLCFRREGGEWTIVHAHSSVPFHPGPEMKAATDLKPE